MLYFMQMSDMCWSGASAGQTHLLADLLLYCAHYVLSIPAWPGSKDEQAALWLLPGICKPSHAAPKPSPEPATWTKGAAVFLAKLLLSSRLLLQPWLDNSKTFPNFQTVSNMLPHAGMHSDMYRHICILVKAVSVSCKLINHPCRGQRTCCACSQNFMYPMNALFSNMHLELHSVSSQALMLPRKLMGCIQICFITIAAQKNFWASAYIKAHPS